nr:MAG TPA: hypothetical protein [Caudoviricetes sp.]
MATRPIVVEAFAEEMELALRAALPAYVKDIRVTPKSVYVGLDGVRGAARTSRSFGVDNRGDWYLRAIEWSPEGRTVTESGRIYAYSPTSREGLARKAADWFRRDFTEVVAQ